MTRDNGDKSVTVLEFRRDTEGFLRRIDKGERLILFYRGKPAARLEPIHSLSRAPRKSDPFLTIGHRATASPKRIAKHHDIDRILYSYPDVQR